MIEVFHFAYFAFAFIPELTSLYPMDRWDVVHTWLSKYQNNYCIVSFPNNPSFDNSNKQESVLFLSLHSIGMFCLVRSSYSNRSNLDLATHSLY